MNGENDVNSKREKDAVPKGRKDISTAIRSRAAEKEPESPLFGEPDYRVYPPLEQAAACRSRSGCAGAPPVKGHGTVSAQNRSMNKKKASRRANRSGKHIYYGIGGNANPDTAPHMPKKKSSSPSRLRKRKKTGVGSGANSTHENKKLRHRQNIAGLKRILLIFIMLLVIAAMVFGIYRLTTVREIIITGSGAYDSERILDRCGLHTGHNIFAYKLPDIEKKINSVPELTVLSIERILPDRIRIVVTDRAQRAAIPSGNGTYTVIDSEGYVMGIGQSDVEGLVIIKGLTLGSFKPGNRIDDCGENLFLRSCAAAELLRAVDAADAEFRDAVTGIDVSNISCVKLILRHNFTAVLGAYPEAINNIAAAVKAYNILLPNYPLGGIINVFDNTTVVDFTPNGMNEDG